MEVDRYLFTIVTVVRNGQDVISMTMDSLATQTSSNYEYLIIDGRSSDGTYNLVRGHIAPSRAWSEPDSGIYEAMNKGIYHSTGEWIGIINAGDFYFPRTLAIVSEAIKSYPVADIIHGDQLYYEEYERFCYFRRQKPRLGEMKLTEGPVLFHPTCFVRKSLYERIGLFDASYRIDADYEFLLRAELAGAHFHYVPELLAGYRAGGASGSCVRFSEGYSILRKYGLHRYTINTIRLLKCLALKCIGRCVDFHTRMERKRLRIS